MDKLHSYIHSFLAVFIAFLAPVHQIMFLTGVLVVIDFITGILAASHRNEKITSKQMRRSVSKLISYQLLVVTAFILEGHFIHGLGIPLIKVCTTLLGLTELKSIAENLKEVTQIDLLSKLSKNLGLVKNEKAKNPRKQRELRKMQRNRP